MKAYIKCVHYHLPAGRVTNEELATRFGDLDSAKVFSKTGIRSRSKAENADCASDLVVAAAETLFRKHNIQKDEIDYIIFCTQTPDYILPTTACLIQDRLGLKTSCGAIDINLGCSGFVYSLSVAKGLVETGQAENILLLVGDTYSKLLNPMDRTVVTLFGDAGAAILVSSVQSDCDLIGPFVFGTDGSGAKNLIVVDGGMRKLSRAFESGRTERPGVNQGLGWLTMNGPEIFNFTIKRIPEVVNDVLKKSSTDSADVKYFIFHQANRFMLEHLRQKIGIERERFPIYMESFGNTVSSSIPIVLSKIYEDEMIKTGDQIMLVGFGVGYSWAGCMLKWV